MSESVPCCAAESYTRSVAPGHFTHLHALSCTCILYALTLTQFPRTRAWLETAMSRESFAKTKRPESKLIELYERFLAVDYSFGGLNQN